MQTLEPRLLLAGIQLAARCGVRLVLVAPRRLLTTNGQTQGVFSVDSAKRLTDRYAAVLPADTLRKYRATHPRDEPGRRLQLHHLLGRAGRSPRRRSPRGRRTRARGCPASRSASGRRRTGSRRIPRWHRCSTTPGRSTTPAEAIRRRTTTTRRGSRRGSGSAWSWGSTSPTATAPGLGHVRRGRPGPARHAGGEPSGDLRVPQLAVRGGDVAAAGHPGGVGRAAGAGEGAAGAGVPAGGERGVTGPRRAGVPAVEGRDGPRPPARPMRVASRWADPARRAGMR